MTIRRWQFDISRVCPGDLCASARTRPHLLLPDEGRDRFRDEHRPSPGKRFSLVPKFLAVSGELLAGKMDPFTVVLDDSSDDLCAPSVTLQNGECCGVIPFGDENTKPN